MADINRRTALRLMGALAASTATTTAARNADPSHTLNLDDREQLFTAFRKLAHSMDDRVGWWWLRGTRFGVVDSVATPFWDMYVGTWFSTRDGDSGTYEVTMAGANFYTPPGSTSLLRTFRNPYTGKDVEIPYSPPRARTTTMSPEKSSPFGELEIPNMKTTQSGEVGPGWIEGDDVVIRGDLALHAEPTDPDSGARPLTVNDWSTYVGKVSEVSDPAVKNAPCRQYFTDILTWPRWLDMGDQAGSYVSRCYGRKELSMGGMPKTWQRLFAEVQPDAARDPDAILKT